MKYKTTAPHKKPSSHKKLIVPAALVALLLIGAGIYGYHVRQRKVQTTAENTTLPVNDTDFNPPSEEIRQETENHKQDLAKPDTTPTSTNGKQTANPTITFAYYDDDTNTVAVGSYVRTIIENGGTCTLILTKDSQKVTKTTVGEVDASATSCPSFNVPRNELSAGIWTGTVSYSSTKAEGTSAKSGSIEVK